VEDEAGWQGESGRDPCLARWATNTRSNFRNPLACLEKGRPSRLVDRTVDATATKKPFVRGVDDSVDRECGDVCLLNTNSRHRLPNA
jgi:hypothetical protein